jgi:eukaryotic-like serine/threonine-protein kinase
LGRYTIRLPLGRGGIGEVYRATDPELGRDVAIKILSHAHAQDKEQMKRFLAEAQAVSALNHPNILSIYDVGTTEGTVYIVFELLEGETLRARLNGKPLAVAKAVDYALQIANGLAAVHDRGIIHRDLKPENLFITRDGIVKILDFGLAKLFEIKLAYSVSEGSTISAIETGPGMVVGTVGYMSPEQVRGEHVDSRSDIFSFGAVLYEMISGQRAFRGNSQVETLNAILTEDIPDLPAQNGNYYPSLERIIRRCLEKDQEARFQSTRDLAFDLRMLVEIPSSSASHQRVLEPVRPSVSRAFILCIGMVLLALGVLTGFLVGKRSITPQSPSYQRLTFRRGMILSARFASDGHSIVYSAMWNGASPEIFTTLPESPEPRPLGLKNADLLAVSSTGEVAVLLNAYYTAWQKARGTLARMPLGGGAPREMLDNVQEADWAPNGNSMAVVHFVEDHQQLEFPIGTPLYSTTGYISNLRISPQGDRVAFIDHALPHDSRGTIMVVDSSGNIKRLTEEWAGGAVGLAWSPSGEEVWFTASKAGEAQALYAVKPTGQQRLISRSPANLILLDISSQGEVLLSRGEYFTEIAGLPTGEATQRDLSWLDYVEVLDITPNGRAIVFSYYGEGAGVNYTTYIRYMDGSPAVRLGEGYASAVSSDGKWVLIIRNVPGAIVLMPTGPGQEQVLPRHGIEQYLWATWFPDGRKILFVGEEAGHKPRCYIQGIDGGEPVPVTPEGVVETYNLRVSSDGKSLLIQDKSGRLSIYSLETGTSRVIPGMETGDAVAGWSLDGQSLYVYRLKSLPFQIFRINLLTGKKERWKEITPSDATGVVSSRILFTPDGKGYVYDVVHYTSSLYLCDGLR